MCCELLFGYSCLQMEKTIQIVNWKKKINEEFYHIDIWETWEINVLNLCGLEILYYAIYSELFLNEYILGKEWLMCVILKIQHT